MATILTCYYRPKPGGFCKRLFRAIEALLARNHTVHYLAITPFPIQHSNCYFHRFPWPVHWNNGLLFWAWFHFLAPFCLIYIGIRHECTHLFAFANTYALILKPLHFVRRLPLSVFLRADILVNHQLAQHPNWLVKLEHAFEYFALADTRCYAVSQTLANTIQSRHHNSPHINIELFPNDIPNLPPRHPRTPHHNLGYVGMLECRKNVELVLNAVKLTSPTIRLDIYGTGPALHSLSDLAIQLELGDRACFHGWTQSNQIWNSIDLLLMPSRHEGAPNAVLEALGVGIPVLASDIPEHREVLPTDCLLPIDNPHLWADKINSILYDEHAFYELVSRQTEHAIRLQFDWDKLITEIITTQPTGSQDA